ncbi:MAG TPA: diguanylate cyclase, partial [Gammaproteobacteria bacterium]|nr:diguanylate cyclase [Gammaproteobacteria bacterium]
QLGHYVLDIRSNHWTSSDVLNEILGMDESYPRTAEGWLEIVHPDSREEMAAYFQDYVLGKFNDFDKTYRIVNLSTREVRW